MAASAKEGRARQEIPHGDSALHSPTTQLELGAHKPGIRHRMLSRVSGNIVPWSSLALALHQSILQLRVRPPPLLGGWLKRAPRAAKSGPSVHQERSKSAPRAAKSGQERPVLGSKLFWGHSLATKPRYIFRPQQDLTHDETQSRKHNRKAQTQTQTHIQPTSAP